MKTSRPLPQLCSVKTDYRSYDVSAFHAALPATYSMSLSPWSPSREAVPSPPSPIP